MSRDEWTRKGGGGGALGADLNRNEITLST